MTDNIHHPRRQKFYAQLAEGEALILFAGAAPRKTADANYRFFANRNFYYLTGILQAQSVFLAVNTGGAITETLFTLKKEAMAERWNGYRLSPEEASELSGVESVRESECFDRELKGLNPGKPQYAAGLTGLATLAFLRAGVRPDSEEHGIVLKRALVWLRARQDENGSFPGGGSNHHIYNHTIATLALCEAYGATQDAHLGNSARKALDWIRKAQNPYSGWRYGIRTDESDTSVTGWAVQALAAGRKAGLEVEDRHFEGALAYVNKVTNKETGRVGYEAKLGESARPNEMLAAFPPAATASMTAAGTLTRVLCGEAVDDEQVVLAVAACMELPPVWDIKAGRTDFYYWYYGTRLMHRVGKTPWRKWKKALEETLPPWQRGKDDGESRGSWDPVGPWGPDGGRVLSTALGALMLDEVLAD